MPTRSTHTGTSRTISRANAQAREEIMSMLMEDHKRVRKAFREFDRMDPTEEAEECQALIERTCADIEVHADLEEQTFYPALREAVSEHQLVDEAEVEHMTARMLMERLKSMDREDEKYPATFKVLGEYIKHHIKEEEGDIFKELSSAKIDWQSLLGEMQSTRQKLLREKGMTVEEETESAEDEES
jgi:predicted unusual protein kinase regulating ubiquinone biosynthesis (AarF/ABC1/UbiB family)